MSKPGSPAGAMFQDICLSWPELAVRKTGDTEHREGGGGGRGRWWHDHEHENRESGPIPEGGAVGTGRQPRATSKSLLLNLRPVLLDGPQSHPCFCWFLRPFSDSTTDSQWKSKAKKLAVETNSPALLCKTTFPETLPFPMTSLSPPS